MAEGRRATTKSRLDRGVRKPILLVGFTKVVVLSSKASSSPAGSDLLKRAMRTAKASYDRCCAAPDFFLCFYRNFFKSCPDVESLFANTDFRRQHDLLRHAIGLLLIFPGHADTEPTLLSRVAERHSRRDLNIDPKHYPDFVDSLVETVREHDPDFTAEVEEAWRHTVAPGIAYMRSHH